MCKGAKNKGQGGGFWVYNLYVSGVSPGRSVVLSWHVWEFTGQIPLYSHFPEEMGGK